MIGEIALLFCLALGFLLSFVYFIVVGSGQVLTAAYWVAFFFLFAFPVAFLTWSSFVMEVK